MPDGVGFQLIIALALLGVLITGGIVAWLHHEKASEDLPPSEEHGIPVGASVGGDPRDLGSEDAARISGPDASLSLTGQPAVLMVVGTEESGVTAVAGKLAFRLVNRGRLVAMTSIGAFSRAAVRKLESWAERAGADLLMQEGDGDAAAGVYEAVEAARARGSDVLIVETSGGIPSHPRMIEELARVKRVLERAAGRVDEVLLVVESIIDQSHTPMSQVRQFDDALGVTGIALSRMDRSEDPRATVAALRHLGIPVKLVGTGENIEDLRGFDPTWLDRALSETEAPGGTRPNFGSRPGVSERPPFAAES